jgi:pyruvate formate-lyase activating enzyme-like uncharacterized protein
VAASTSGRERLIEKNRQEYGDRYGELRFLSAPEAEQAAARRQELLSALSGRVETGFGGTKLDCKNLSPGCRICGEGGWSCLFINGRCNLRCFYCPTSQEEIGLPTTNTVNFRTPTDYVAYLERFGFTGASISGGEPFLTFPRSLAFVAAIKKRFGAAMYVWLYTNGTLVDEENLLRLRDAGLDEIRFDIGATAYRLDPLRLAVGTIPTVSVEIPAIAEDLELLKDKMVEMRDAGVNHLNLHQLRLTPYNRPKLVPRGYRYLHGEKVTVLDSELAALELLHYAVDRQIGPPVNYCSFAFKNRYQGLAARRRNASFLIKPFESLTANGYIRTLTLLGPPEAIARQAELFRENGAASDLWTAGSSREQLAFSPLLRSLVDWNGFRLLVGYAACRQLPAVSYRNLFVNVKVNDNKQIIIERAKAAGDFELSGDEAVLFARLFLGSAPPPAGLSEGPLAEPAGFEQVAEGLQDYF